MPFVAVCKTRLVLLNFCTSLHLVHDQLYTRSRIFLVKSVLSSFRNKVLYLVTLFFLHACMYQRLPLIFNLFLNAILGKENILLAFIIRDVNPTCNSFQGYRVICRFVYVNRVNYLRRIR